MKLTRVKTKSNNKTLRIVFRWMFRKDASLKAKKGGRRWIAFILTLSDFCLKIIYCGYPCYVKKDTTIGQCLLAIIWNCCSKFKFIARKNRFSTQCLLLYALFIPFLLRHKDYFQFDGRHCIGDLSGHTMVWKSVYSERDR